MTDRARAHHDEGVEPEVSGLELGAWLRNTRDAFAGQLESGQLSQQYIAQARAIIGEFADFCEGRSGGDPWQLREAYLQHRPQLRAQRRTSFSHGYLQGHGRQLRRFLQWYLKRVQRGRLGLGELPQRQLGSYWRLQGEALPHERRIVQSHLGLLLPWLARISRERLEGSLDDLLSAYFRERIVDRYGHGYGFVLNHRAAIVTRRHLVWLEQCGRLHPGSAGRHVQMRGSRQAADSRQALHDKVQGQVRRAALPSTLQQRLLEYLQHAIHQRGLERRYVLSMARVNLTLCERLARTGLSSFESARSIHVEQTLEQLLTAPVQDVLRRRRQVQRISSFLRGFLRFLHDHRWLKRDLASTLVNPPCYGDSRPPTVLSHGQVLELLESVDRSEAAGRRCYAILALMTTYGLRAVDVAFLRLDAIDWSQGKLSLIQKKTKRALRLPLLPHVAEALADYLKNDRLARLPHRQIFVSQHWPHPPLRPNRVAELVRTTLRAAGLDWAQPKHLRSTVATHLFRNGVALSTVQEILGHRTVETTQRYASADVEMLREVLKDDER
jgi:site-specific recombinase XerD